MRGKLAILFAGPSWPSSLLGRLQHVRPRRRAHPRWQLIRGRLVTIETTAYCPCGKCCGWKLNWRGQPVHTSGKSRGKPKAVGITASGKKAKPGTLAADTRYYPFGTVIYIPGYGYGIVEDRGGDIKGRHRLDLYYNTHKEARHWGRKSFRWSSFPKGTPPIPKNARPPH
jgi:3D (Asp-Asp-Asp) domain-containing protein